jgi:hypothetical protein
VDGHGGLWICSATPINGLNDDDMVAGTPPCPAPPHPTASGIIFQNAFHFRVLGLPVRSSLNVLPDSPGAGQYTMFVTFASPQVSQTAATSVLDLNSEKVNIFVVAKMCAKLCLEKKVSN